MAQSRGQSGGAYNVQQSQVEESGVADRRREKEAVPTRIVCAAKRTFHTFCCQESPYFLFCILMLLGRESGGFTRFAVTLGRRRAFLFGTETCSVDCSGYFMRFDVKLGRPGGGGGGGGGCCCCCCCCCRCCWCW